MATDLATRVSLSCLLCFKDYNVPRTLPCHHTFCEECLKLYIKAHSGVDFVCPVGCHVTVDTTTSVNELIRSFPLNAMYVSLTKSAGVTMRACDHCPADTVARPGTMWCEQCKGSLCADCTIDHRKRRISMNHDVIDIGTARNHDVNTFSVDEKCPSHNGRSFVSFCSVHYELLCPECGTSRRHLNCELWSIADASQRNVGSVNFEEMTRKISELCYQQEQNLKELDTQYGEHLVTMNAKITEVKDRLDRLHKMFQVKVLEEKKIKKHQLDILQQTRMFQTELENNTRICSTVTKNVARKQSFVLMTQITEQTREHFQTIQQLLNGCIDIKVELKLADTLQDIETLDSVGGIVETCYNSVVFKDALNDMQLEFTPDPWKDQHSSSTGSENKDDSSYFRLNSPSVETSLDETIPKIPYKKQPTVEYSQPNIPRSGFSELPRPCVPCRPDLVLDSSLRCVVSVKASDLGNRTWLTGGTYLPDGRLILADFGNGQIVLCDERYNVIRKERMEEGPQEVAYCEVQNTIYVRTGIHIAKFSLDKHGLRKLGTIELPHGSNHHCGIELYEDTIVVGSLESVILMTKEGRVLRVIKREGKPYAVTVCRTLKQFCYVHNKDIVYCLMDGSEVYRQNRKEHNCKKVRGMCLDMYGHLYVCCVTSPRGYIYQLPKNGQKGRTLSYQGGIKRPRFVMYHPKKHEFIVTSFQESIAFESVTFACMAK
ncbi:uncharacterized protein LOC117343418 [Pecten maximus]|uniref:uncharacterized protein LOC117343418 n=1 Tax=Pecten maximus TaxID=6579 RepID=UPI00145807E4|nr:uncharacterized protein LOC117343418 [Pecten maximus]